MNPGCSSHRCWGWRSAFPRVDVLYTSPLLRARQTAQMIAQMHGLQKLEPVVEPGLSELDGGLLEGRRFDELAVEYPQVMQTMYHAPAQLCCPGGESMKQLSERIVQTVDRIVRQNQGKVIVAVSHGIVISSYIHFVSGKPFEQMSNGMVANASVSKFLFNDDLIVCMEYADDRRHMKNGTYLTTRGFEPNQIENPDPYAVRSHSHQ